MNALSPEEQHAYLLKLARMKMPFGKHEGVRLIDLPEPYLGYFARNSWPKGQLGEMMRMVYETRANGDSEIFTVLRKLARS